MIVKAKYFKKLWGGAGQLNILQEKKNYVNSSVLCTSWIIMQTLQIIHKAFNE